jgi:HEAT repeat protein
MGLTKPGSGQLDDAREADGSPDFESLIEDLHDAHPEVRRSAVLNLRNQRKAIPALLTAYPQESAPATREALFTVLAEHDDLEVAKAFAADLGVEDAVLRNAAADALNVMPKAVSLIIRDLLAAPEPRARAMAIMVLGALAHKQVLSWVACVVEQDSDENVVAAAIEAALQAGGNAPELLAVAVDRFPDNAFLRFLADKCVSSP